MGPAPPGPRLGAEGGEKEPSPARRKATMGSPKTSVVLRTAAGSHGFHAEGNRRLSLCRSSAEPLPLSPPTTRALQPKAPPEGAAHGAAHAAAPVSLRATNRKKKASRYAIDSL